MAQLRISADPSAPQTHRVSADLDTIGKMNQIRRAPEPPARSKKGEPRAPEPLPRLKKGEFRAPESPVRSGTHGSGTLVPQQTANRSTRTADEVDNGDKEMTSGRLG
jgi:hypothetical protein